MKKSRIPIIVAIAALVVVSGAIAYASRTSIPKANRPTIQIVNGTYQRTNNAEAQTASITVASSKQAGAVHISGQALWGAAPSHGDIEADVSFKNGHAQYVAPKGPGGLSCTIDFNFMPGTLDVSVANLPACGEDPLVWGANVTFEGHYVLAATYVSATEKAKSMPAQALKQEILSTYKDFTATNSKQELLLLSAYTSVYLSSNPNDTQISDINDSLVTKFGACYGLPEGQCKE